MAGMIHHRFMGSINGTRTYENQAQGGQVDIVGVRYW